jgi:uncharacterized protein YndB with AHSA1/START domain
MDMITVAAHIDASPADVWRLYTDPEAIMKWNAASPDWHTPRAENDLRVGGRFTFRMEAKDRSEGFDFGGTYTEVVPQSVLAYTMDDGRAAQVRFAPEGEGTSVTVSFDPESVNPPEMQHSGWQAILDNFKAFVEQQ